MFHEEVSERLYVNDAEEEEEEEGKEEEEDEEEGEEEGEEGEEQAKDTEASRVSTQDSTETTTQSFVPSSSDDTSVRRVQQQKEESVLYYLITTEGDYSFQLTDKSIRWNIGNNDVSEAFMQYRNKCIDKAEESKELDTYEQLALDGIMLIDDNLPVQSMVPYYMIEPIKEELDTLDIMEILDTSKYEDEILKPFIRNMTQRSVDKDRIREDLLQWQAKHGVSKTREITCVLSDYLSTYSSGYDNESDNEATLVRDTIDPFFRAYFHNNNHYKCLSADCMIKSSSQRFKNIDPSLATSGKRSDFYIVSLRDEHLILAFEAKSGSNYKKGDQVKIGKELKDSIIAIEKQGHKEVTLIGIIMKGVAADVYMFDHRFDGLYRMMLYKTVYFPRSRHDLQQLRTLVPLFKALQSVSSKSSIELAALVPSDTSCPYSQMVTMHTPIVTRTKRMNLDVNNPSVKNARRKLF